jgi:NDP-sugar pyrophosphorylase family protein
VIEDGVNVDDFCKIIGPAYLSCGSFIGMSSLIRNSILGNNTKIGFNCEIGRSYFAGNTKISHQNVLLDSIIGEHVWLGGFSGTANVLREVISNTQLEMIWWILGQIILEQSLEIVVR